MLRSIFILKFSAFIGLLFISAISVAAPFVVTYTDTVAVGSTAPFNIGEAFTISVVLDNGSSNTISQTWTGADIVSVTFNINNVPNTITTVFSPVVLTSSSGNFATDASGDLIEAPSSWVDNQGVSTIQSTNDPSVYTALQWFINDGNAVYFDNEGDQLPLARMTDVQNNTDPSFWSTPVSATTSEAAAVPALSQWALILLGLILLAFGFVKTRQLR